MRLPLAYARGTVKEQRSLYFLSASRVPSHLLYFFSQARNRHEISQLSQFTMARGVIIPPPLALASSSGRVRLRESDQPRGFRHMATTHTWLESIERVSEEIIAPAAAKIDASGAFPRAAIEALGKAGLLGLVSGKEVGG